jgi:hypothetical protein
MQPISLCTEPPSSIAADHCEINYALTAENLKIQASFQSPEAAYAKELFVANQNGGTAYRPDVTVTPPRVTLLELLHFYSRSIKQRGCTLRNVE